MKTFSQHEKSIEYSPILLPTYEQWKSLAIYLTHHESSLQKRYGAVKIIPPTRWTPLLKNPYEIRHIKTYRKQEVVRSSHQSDVLYIEKTEVNKRRLISYDEFKALAESEVYRLQDDINTNIIDHFWATVTKVAPISANDVDGSLFNKKENVFNMLCLPSLLKYYPRTIPGVTHPTLHLSMWANAVGLHIDDHDLTSFHYHHTGATRIWFIINPSSYGKLEEIINELKLFSDLPLSCLSPLQHKSLLLDPSFLHNHSIGFSVIEQKMNELVIIFPGVYHFYFDTGFNLIESVRYALPSWLTFQRMSPRLCSCTNSSSSSNAKINRRFFTNEVLRRFEQEHLSSTVPICVDSIIDDEKMVQKKPTSVSVSVQTDEISSFDLTNDISCDWLCSTEGSTSTEQHSSDIDELWSTLEQISTPKDTYSLSNTSSDFFSSSVSYTPPQTFAEIYRHLLESKPKTILNWRRLKNRKCYHCRRKGHLNRDCPYSLRK